mmetsp:Transcript_6348/g.7286  ORF Transcript_6348/g.7286 Transcript_6348/m.7286 type:complete len:202 (-) Transcript_6348:669-1274(-)
MNDLFKVHRRDDYEINGLPEVHEVLLSDILNLLLFRLRALLFFVELVDTFVDAVFFLAKDLLFDLVPLLLVFLVLRIELEKVRFVFRVELVRQADLVGDPVFFLDQIEFLNHARVAFELGLPNAEEVLDCVLDSPVTLALVKDAFEPFEDGNRALLGQVPQDLSAFDHEIGSHLNAVFSRVLQKQREDLEGDDFVEHLLVD